MITGKDRERHARLIRENERLHRDVEYLRRRLQDEGRKPSQGEIVSFRGDVVGVAAVNGSSSSAVHTIEHHYGYETLTSQFVMPGYTYPIGTEVLVVIYEPSQVPQPWELGREQPYPGATFDANSGKLTSVGERPDPMVPEKRPRP